MGSETINQLQCDANPSTCLDLDIFISQINLCEAEEKNSKEINNKKNSPSKRAFENLQRKKKQN
jgi:hypothetical protein